MESKREILPQEKLTQAKNILFSCFVWLDGLGDLGHLVSVAKPAVLKSMSVKIDAEAVDAINTLYFIICKYEQIEFVIEALISANIIKQEEEAFSRQLKEFGEDDDTDNFVDAYVQTLSERNPNIFVYVGAESVDIPRELLAEIGDENDDYSELELRIKNRLKGTRFYEQMQNTILQVNVSTPLAINIFKDLEHTPLKINIGEHDSGYFTRNSLDECVMGFGDDHQGIFLEDIKPMSLEQKIDRVAKIQNKEYLLNLISLQQLKQQDAKMVEKESFGLAKVDLHKHIKQFLDTTLFIPGYIQDPIAMATFISSLSCSYPAKRSEEIVFHINKSSFDSSMLAENLLRAHGITAIEINDAGKITTKVLIENVTRVRKIKILTGFYLSNEDYEFLFQIAQYFAGCSGDKSLEQTLSAELIPFYAARPWKRIFVDNFAAAGKKFSEDKAVTAYNEFFNQTEIPIVRKIERFPAPSQIDPNEFYLIKKNKNPADKGKHTPGTWKLFEPVQNISTGEMELCECKAIPLKEYDGWSDIALDSNMNTIQRKIREYLSKTKVHRDATYIALRCNTPQFYSEYKKIIKGFKENYNFRVILPDIFSQGVVFYQLQRAVNDGDLDNFNLYRTFEILDVMKDVNGLNDFLRIALMINDEKLTMFLLKLFMKNINDSGKFKIETPRESFMLDLKYRQEFFDEFFDIITKYKDKILPNESLVAIMKEFKLDASNAHNYFYININMQIQQFLASPVKIKEKTEGMEDEEHPSDNFPNLIISSSSSSRSSLVSDTGMFTAKAENNKKRKTQIGHDEDESHKKAHAVFRSLSS